MRKQKKKSFSKKKIIIGTSILGGLLIIGGYKTYNHIQNNKVLSEAKVKTPSLVIDDTYIESEEPIKKEEKKKEESIKEAPIKKEESKKEEKKKETTKPKKNISAPPKKKKKEEKKKDTTLPPKKEEEKKDNIIPPKKEEKEKEKNNTTPPKKEDKEKEKEKDTTPEQTGIEGKIAKTNIAKQTNQIILVVKNELSLWNKSNGKWTKSLSSNSRLGYGGLTSNKHEGDGATPTGVYPILYGFGFGSNPGTGLEYKKITNNSYFVDDANSKYYNQWYEGNNEKGEHMMDHPQYKYGMVIGYNTNHIKGKGSAIFLHCNGRGNTAGCVSVSENNMLNLLKSTHQGAYIIITSNENNLKYY